MLTVRAALGGLIFSSRCLSRYRRVCSFVCSCFLSSLSLPLCIINSGLFHLNPIALLCTFHAVILLVLGLDFPVKAIECRLPSFFSMQQARRSCGAAGLRQCVECCGCQIQPRSQHHWSWMEHYRDECVLQCRLGHVLGGLLCRVYTLQP